MSQPPQGHSPFCPSCSTEPCQPPANTSWFDRVLILPKYKLLFCGIEKNAIKLLSKLVNTAMGACDLGRCSDRRNFSWLPFSAETTNLTLCAYRDLLRVVDWRKIVVYRDPMERFLSAHSSKCLLNIWKGDADGRVHCQELFNLPRYSTPSLLHVARRLGQYGHLNPHWAPQGSFCGGTVASQWTSYSHHVPFHNLSLLLDIFRAAGGPSATHHALQEAVRAPSDSKHITHAAAKIRDQEPALRQLLFDYHADDYRLFHMHYLYELQRR